MMKKLLFAGMLMLGAMGISGNAMATCQSGAAGAGYYSVCVLESYADPFYSSDTPLGLFYADGSGYTGVYTNQYGYNYPGCCEGSGTNAQAYGYNTAVGYYNLGAYQNTYNYPCCGFAGQNTGVFANGPAGYNSAGQDVFGGSCTVYTNTPAGYQPQACGPVPAVPVVPQL
jgi:hypothetical protein